MIKIWKWFFQQSTRQMHLVLFGFTAFLALPSLGVLPYFGGPALTFLLTYTVVPIMMYRVRGKNVSQKV